MPLNEVLEMVDEDCGLAIAPDTCRWNRRIEAALPELLALPQIPLPITDHFPPGVYVREGTLLKGNFYIGKAHKEKHLSVFLTGRASLVMNGKLSEIVAPCFVMSEPGVMKMLYIHEDLRGANIHANPRNLTNQDQLEAEFVFPVDTFTNAEIEDAINLLRLQEHRS